jgi:hypothetical protein
MKRLLSGAPGFQGQFRIVRFAEGVTDNEFARMIDQRHQLRSSPASTADDLRVIRIQNLEIIDFGRTCPR